MYPHYLAPLFDPASVAVLGASDRQDSVGGIIFRNLKQSGFIGKRFAVNPKHTEVDSETAYASIQDLPERVDLAVIATPAAVVPNVVADCGKLGVPAAVVITAGFSEVGEAGSRLEARLLDSAKQHGIRLLGPNCLGIMRPRSGLNATFGHRGAIPGGLALVSQSGALCTAVLDWAVSENVGFSSVISTGASADVGFGEILDFLVADRFTTAIVLYVEGIRDARRFVSSLRAAARAKPVLVLKSGRHAQGSRAAFSHTGALVGSDDVFDAVLQRTGSVRVRLFSNLFAAAKTLSLGVRTAGNRLAIVTNGGGPGVMAADALADKQLTPAELSSATLQRLDQALPSNWSRGNPIDLIGDAGVERYRIALDSCLADADVDAALVLLTPQAMTEPEAVAREVLNIAKRNDKPVLTCWMGEDAMRSSRALFAEHALPSYRTPEAAVEAFSVLAAYRDNQLALLQTPGPLIEDRDPDLESARMIVEDVLADGREVLGPVESKALLAAFRIPIASSTLARTASEALLVAQELGFPVAVKICSSDITHKSDVGGVRLNIADARSLRRETNDLLRCVAAQVPNARIDGVVVEPMVRSPNGRELIAGVVTDPVFGPVISFGVGGTMVEVIGDRAVSLPPLNRYLARRLIASTRAAKLLERFRNLPPADVDAIIDVLLRISEMVCELPEIREMDLNPLIADEHGVTVADARVLVRRRPPGRAQYAHMAIHPYPAHLERSHLLSDGTELTMRPIRPEDAHIESRFVRGLSQRSRHYRFMYAMKELTPEMLSSFTQIDYDREMALIAVVREQGEEHQIGVARYVTNPDGQSCEMAVVVADEWQGKGIATTLLESLIEVARSRRLRRMEGIVLSDNRSMLQLARRHGFNVHDSDEGPGLVTISKRL